MASKKKAPPSAKSPTRSLKPASMVPLSNHPPHVPVGGKLPQPPGVKPQPLAASRAPGSNVPGNRPPQNSPFGTKPPKASLAGALNESPPSPELAALADEGPTLEPGISAGRVSQVANPTAGNTPVAPHGQAGAGVAAALREIPKSQKVHYKELHPGTELLRDAVTGQETPIQFRTGGQYSVRRLVLVNQVNPQARARILLVRNSDEQQVWPIQAHERIADPSKYPQDAPLGPGNLEVVFDDEREYRAYWQAHGNLSGAAFDPLKMNDVPEGQFPPDLRLPGGAAVPPPPR